ncbi:unnamed protein product [Paramecium primaurelia]|uniref:Uncharacterized protein n=1 Tax=Paramecium primaurelia TaxID=5886 RepID=A0A8S1LX97_PARPR|nr:unnamed protein product [Paramecium primaurelia]
MHKFISTFKSLKYHPYTVYPIQQLSRLLIQAILNQWIKCSKIAIQYYNHKQFDLYPTFQNIKLNYNQKLNLTFFEQLSKLLPSHSPYLNVLEPCYLWAQNMTHLFLKIKFTTKIDIPGAQTVNNFQINITEPSLYIEAYSFELLNRYVLRIKTYKFMNPIYFHYQFVELGQVIIEILKSPSPYFWKNVHSNIMYNPPNQYIWWDMYYQYRGQLEVAFGLLEDTENKREEMERQKLSEDLKMRESKKQYKKIKEDNQELYKQLYCRYCNPLDGDEWSSWII